MHVHLVAQQPSSHQLFRHKPEAPPNRVQSRTHNHIDRHFKHAGPAILAYQFYGKVGMLIGVLESLQDASLEGEVSITVSRGSYTMTGSLSIFNPAMQPAVQEALMAAERIAQGLAFDAQLRELELTFTQEITEIGGNC